MQMIALFALQVQEESVLQNVLAILNSTILICPLNLIAFLINVQFNVKPASILLPAAQPAQLEEATLHTALVKPIIMNQHSKNAFLVLLNNTTVLPIKPVSLVKLIAKTALAVAHTAQTALITYSLLILLACVQINLILFYPLQVTRFVLDPAWMFLYPW